jgi:nucleoside-diphosphate-sugar epimerase
MKILITGASGLVGAAVAQRLESEGYDVVRLKLRPDTVVETCPELSQAYEGVVHCGWEGVEAADRRNIEMQRRNIRVFEDLMEYVSYFPPRWFITFGSQAELYQPGTPYSQAKQACREVLEATALQTGMRYLWLQLFSLYGDQPGQKWLIPCVTAKLLRHEPIDLTGGEQTMDFLHVSDVASAVVAGINSEAIGIYQVGSGNGFKVRAIVTALHGLTHSKSVLNWGALPYRSDQVMNACADPRAFQRETGWLPLTDFHEGLYAVVDREQRKLNANLR